MQAVSQINRKGQICYNTTFCQYSLMANPTNNFKSANLFPPIELTYFQAKEQMEDTIIRWMHRIISNQQQFTVQIKQDISADTGNLQLNITDKLPFQQLITQLKVVNQYINSNGCPDMQFRIQPQLNFVQTEYMFNGFIEIREFVLLKKYHHFDAYKQVNVFGLRP